MAQKYKNIPVKPEVYASVQVIAESNNRGLGDQVSAWVERELPFCDHPKQAVNIEIYPSAENAGGARLDRKGWYCPTCNRVYQYESEIKIVIPKRGKRAKKAVTA